MRIATFNVENLFERTKVFNFREMSEGSKILARVSKLEAELERSTYDKPKIMALYEELKEYVDIIEDRGKLWKRKGFAIAGVKANGPSDWDGSVVLKRAKFSKTARGNTAKVILDTKADILCLVEVESRNVLHRFNSELLAGGTLKAYPRDLSLEGNDLRGIDLGLLSRFDLGAIHTHMFDEANGRRIFSRDCLEVEVKLSKSKSLFVLLNHFKSKGYGKPEESDAKRLAQATRVRDIVKGYNLAKDLVVVCGDFNDTPNSAALAPLLSVNGLHDVLEKQFGNSVNQRWTYYYKTRQQIDFLLVSTPLVGAMTEAGVERRGIDGLESKSTTGEKSYPTVTHFTNAASDHGAVWADFSL